MSRPTLRQIDCLLALRDCANFSRAAERLGLSQPALSQQVKDLEALLDVRLVDRTTRRVALTAAGQHFALGAERALAELDHARALAEGHGRLAQGRLRIAAPPLLAASLLPRLMAAFAKDHPGLALELADLPTAEIIIRLRDGRADLGLGTFPPGLPDLETRVLARDELMVFAPTDHPAGAMTWQDLPNHPLIALHRDSGLRLLAEEGFTRAGLTPTHLRPKYEVAQITTALAMVEAGFGLAVLPGYARFSAAKVQALPLQNPTLHRELTALIPHDRSAPPALQTFLALLTKALRPKAS